MTKLVGSNIEAHWFEPFRENRLAKQISKLVRHSERTRWQHGMVSHLFEILKLLNQNFMQPYRSISFPLTIADEQGLFLY